MEKQKEQKRGPKQKRGQIYFLTGLVRSPAGVELDPIRDHATGMLLALEPVPVYALLLQRPDHAFHHAVLLWTVRLDELPLEAMATDQPWRRKKINLSPFL